MKNYYRIIIQVFITVLAFWGLWILNDIEKVTHLLINSNFSYFLCAVIVVFFQLVLSTLRWRVFTSFYRLNFNLRELYRGVFLSFLVGHITPSSLFGEVARFQYLKTKENLTNLIKSILLERLSGQVVLLIWVLFLTPITAFYFIEEQSHLWMVLVVALLGISLVLLTYFLSKKPFINYFWVQKVKNFLEDVFRGLISQENKTHFLYSLISLLLMVLQFYFSALALNVSVSFLSLMLFFPYVLLILSVPISFGGWGVRELSSAFILLPLIQSVESITAVSFVYGISFVVALIPGLIYLLFNSCSNAFKVRSRCRG